VSVFYFLVVWGLGGVKTKHPLHCLPSIHSRSQTTAQTTPNNTVLGNAIAGADPDSSTYDGLLEATARIFCETREPPRAWMLAMSVAVQATKQVPCRLINDALGAVSTSCPAQFQVLAKDGTMATVLVDCGLLPASALPSKGGPSSSLSSAGGLTADQLQKAAAAANNNNNKGAPRRAVGKGGKGAGATGSDSPNLTDKWPVCVELSKAAGLSSISVRSRPCAKDGAVLGSWRAGSKLAAVTGKSIASGCKDDKSRWVQVRYNGQRGYAMASVPSASSSSKDEDAVIVPCGGQRSSSGKASSSNNKAPAASGPTKSGSKTG
jgi:hypothetical protein